VPSTTKLCSFSSNLLYFSLISDMKGDSYKHSNGESSSNYSAFLDNLSVPLSLVSKSTNSVINLGTKCFIKPVFLAIEGHLLTSINHNFKSLSGKISKPNRPTPPGYHSILSQDERTELTIISFTYGSSFLSHTSSTSSIFSLISA
jgi:hypothetical protein